jgi:hypothetical protein
MAIYASLVHGLDLPLWGAFGFSIESVRNDLQNDLKSGDYVLAIGTSGEPTPGHLQGRLIGLLTLARQQVRTGDYVEPNHWQAHLDGNGGQPRWPYGMPIIEAELFVEPLPVKNDALPRISEQNLHMKLATNYERLTPAEEAAVMSLTRVRAPAIYKSEGATFQEALLPRRPGPPPTDKHRTSVPTFGAAATYLMVLDGTHARNLASRGDRAIFKIGFSRDPQARLKALNCFYPKPELLRWKIEAEQWHADAVNAYAMEQHALSVLHASQAKHLQGEIYEGRLTDAVSAFSKAKRDAVRPPNGQLPQFDSDLMF